MNPPRLKYEGWLYGLAFLIALGLRLLQLGTAPLTDSEANLALQALHIANGTRPLLGPQPAYILLTSVLFLIFESTNFLARLVPALVGSAMVFAPMFFREKLGARPALILAFLFAIDPGLVALSRLAGGVVLAVAFTLFAWGMWNRPALCARRDFRRPGPALRDIHLDGTAGPGTRLALRPGRGEKTLNGRF